MVDTPQATQVPVCSLHSGVWEKLAWLEDETGDHEVRIRNLEQVHFKAMGWVAGAAAVATIASQLIIHIWLK
jgi:hypothetical protein